MINSKLVRLHNTKNDDKQNATLKTINGVNKTDGMITIIAKIFDIEEEIDIFIVNNESFNNDLIIGLDLIEKFKLIQDEKLRVTQKIPDFTGKKIKNIDSINDNVKLEFKVNFNEHIEENFEISINHLDIQERSKIDEILDKYKSIFAKDKYDVGTVKDYEAHIDLTVEEYCSKRPYKCSAEDRKEIQDQVLRLLGKKLVEESYSPFAAPVTLAYKRDEGKKSRLCIDFRDLNKLVVPQSQPFPLIEDLVQKTRNCKYFSTLDINPAFWSISLRFSTDLD